MSIILKMEVKKHLPIKEGTTKDGKPWAVAKFVAEEVGKEHPQKGVFELYKGGEYVKYAKGFESDTPVGSNVTIEFNLAASEWKGNYFPTLRVWKVTVDSKPVDSQSQNSNDENLDLPF